jgi:hypothetical protein
MKDRWRGFVSGLTKREFDHFTDHSILRYIEYIQRAVAEEESVERSLLSIERLKISPANGQARRAA